MLIRELQTAKGCLLAELDAARLDSQVADRFRAEITEVLGRCAGLALDLHKTGFIDSVGLGALLFATRKAAVAGKTLVFCGLQPNIRALVGLVKMDRVLNLLEERQQALAMLEGQVKP